MKPDQKFKSLSDLIGKGINIKESKQNVKKQEKEYFLSLVTELIKINADSLIINSLGVNLMEHENKFIIVIKLLLDKVYGEDKSSIILWWVFESISPEGEVLPIVDDNGKEYFIKTPNQLYEFLKKM
jgi:hypothetical protein